MPTIELDETLENSINDAGSQSNISSVGAKKSAHLNPDWLQDLLHNLREEVIDPCSSKVREAVSQNKVFEDDRDKRQVRMEIKGTLVSKLVEIFGGVSRPELRKVRKIVQELQILYPALFKEDKSRGYGLGGNVGVDGFAEQVLDAIRKRDGRARVGGKRGGDDSVEVLKGKKTKIVYGVDVVKFNSTKESSTEVSSKVISANSDEMEFDQREKIYTECRQELQCQFNTSQKTVAHQCRGFWKDYRHVENHFAYLTNSDDLTTEVEKNFKSQMRNIELYLRHTSKNLEFEDTMNNITNKCEVEYDGSQTFKDIQLVRMLGDSMDSKGSALVRISNDGPPKTDSPHLFAAKVNKTFVFEVIVDKERVLGNLTFPQAIASLLHIAFVFNLKYPQVYFSLTFPC